MAFFLKQMLRYWLRVGVTTLLLLIAALCVAIPVLLFTHEASAAESVREARPAIGRLVSKAQAYLSHHRYSSALKALQAADELAGRTPYEAYVIEETRVSIYVARKDDSAAVKALEAALATGMVPVRVRLRQQFDLVGLSYRAGNLKGVIEHGKAYYREGGKDETPHLLMAQAYYHKNQYPEAIALLNGLVECEQSRGRRPNEDVIRLLLSATYHQKGRAGYRNSLAVLVKNYPSQSNWESALSYARASLNPDDPLLLFIDRLEWETGAVKNPASYMDAAQLALLHRHPTEAKAILDDGYSRHILGQSGNIDRQRRLYALAFRLSREEIQNLPQLTQGAEASPRGNKFIELGQILANAGDTRKAIAIFGKGIRRGGLEHEGEAYLALGIAYLQADTPQKAIAAFQQAKKTRESVVQIAQFWEIHAKAMLENTNALNDEQSRRS